MSTIPSNNDDPVNVATEPPETTSSSGSYALYNVIIAIANSTEGLAAIATALFSKLGCDAKDQQAQLDQLNDINDQMDALDDPDSTTVDSYMAQTQTLSSSLQQMQNYDNNIFQFDLNNVEMADSVTQDAGRSVEKSLEQLEKPIGKRN